MNAPVLTVERPDEETAVITLNRPERRNALTIELLESLCHSLEQLVSQPRQRVVVLRGAGPAFCAGLDLDEAVQPELAHQSALVVARTLQTVASASLVTIAAVHGAAYAGGAALMAACDFIVAADDLRVCFPEVRRGLIPSLAAVVLQQRIRKSELRELFLLAQPIDAQRALQIGLIDRVVFKDQLMTAARGIAALVLQGGPSAVRETKRLLRRCDTVDRQELFAHALEVHEQARAGAEAREGVAAFHQHREPDWTSCIE